MSLRLARPKSAHGRQKRKGPEPPAGVHCLLDLVGCPPGRLNDPVRLRAAIRDACKVGGLRILRLVLHRFRPHGITALALLAESHLAIHTWPERSYAAIDLFTCGNPGRLAAVCDLLRARLGASSQRRTRVGRGPTVRTPD